MNLKQLSWLGPHKLPAARKDFFSGTCLHAGKAALAGEAHEIFLSSRASERHKVGVRGGGRDGDRYSLPPLIPDTPPFVPEKICPDSVFLNRLQPEELINWKELD